MTFNQIIKTLGRRLPQIILVIIPVVVAFSSISGLFSALLISPPRDDSFSALHLREQMSQTAELQREVASFQASLANLKQSLTTINDDQKTAVRLQEFSGRLDLTDSRLKALEIALVEDPEKALSVPLLRRDLAALQQSLDIQRAAAKTELERIYDFNKWFFGLFAALALSIVGLAATSVFKERKIKPE